MQDVAGSYEQYKTKVIATIIKFYFWLKMKEDSKYERYEILIDEHVVNV